MPPPVLATLGVTLIALANYDALVTTVAIGSGIRPLTMHVTRAQRRLLRTVPRLLPAGGPVIVLTTVGLWIVLLWAGYSLLFAADSSAVTSTTGGVRAAGVSRVYYAGYTLFTLGNGGYQPAPGLWELVTNVATLNGLFVTTLAITYLVPVVSAVVQRRQVAALVTALGSTAEDAVVAAWNGRDFGFLEQQLPGIAQGIMLTAQRHVAYPVLHDFRSAEPRTASERTLALLDDMLTLVERGVQPSVRLQSATVLVVRTAIDQARELMPVGDTRRDVPPLPDVTVLAARGIPTCPPGEFATATAELADRRGHLAALVEAAGWRWPNRAAEVNAPSPSAPG